MQNLLKLFEKKEAQDLLARVNSHWEKQFNAALSAGLSLWPAEADIISEIDHLKYERFLPVKQFLADYRAVFETVLTEEQIPIILHSDNCRSIVDLRRLIPQVMKNTLSVDAENLAEFYFALSSPCRFGTAEGRYPQQINFLMENYNNCNERLLIRDYACGNGLGTYEIAATLSDMGLDFEMEGLSIEFAEIWMAVNKTVPYDQTLNYPIVACPIHFEQFDMLSGELRSPVDLIIMNGIIAGPFLHTDDDFNKILKRLEYELKDDAIALICDQFHAGFDKHKMQFVRLAEKRFKLDKTEKMIVINKKNCM